MEYLPGADNIQADWESQHISDSSDWMLDQQAQQPARELYQLEKGPLWTGDECISSGLGDGRNLCFPPFSLIPKVLFQDTERQSNLPLWQAQARYPTLLEMLLDIPVLNPETDRLLTSLVQGPHPLIEQSKISGLKMIRRNAIEIESEPKTTHPRT